MKLLLDTHLLLWAVGSPGQLSATTRALLEEAENELFFSAAEPVGNRHQARPRQERFPGRRTGTAQGLAQQWLQRTADHQRT
ncbi:hypothetical protein [Azotobacter beijerinckii]|uniref:hypothetical protein n=1 Tax=Azotobacter beijerinckii TaxID=170623 RepID=UPI001C3140A1|nr:hypothetical protein [Azotobacter beijerinckii]